MKTINTYITEKLKINKDSKDSSSYNEELINKIYNNVIRDKNFGDEEYMKKQINYWLSDNNIKSIHIYVSMKFMHDMNDSDIEYNTSVIDNYIDKLTDDNSRLIKLYGNNKYSLLYFEKLKKKDENILYMCNDIERIIVIGDTK